MKIASKQSQNRRKYKNITYKLIFIYMYWKFTFTRQLTRVRKEQNIFRNIELID